MNMVEQLSVKLDVKSYGHMPTSGIVRSYGALIFSFMRILHRFLEWLHQFIIQQTLNEDYEFFKASLAFYIGHFVYYCDSD